MEMYLFYAIPILMNPVFLCGYGFLNGYGREARRQYVNITLALNLCMFIAFTGVPEVHNVENFFWITGWSLILMLTLAIPLFMETQQLHAELHKVEPQKKPKARKE